MSIVKKLKKISIQRFLENKGYVFNEDYFCSSPFSRDSNWSFKYYPETNSFFDWSKGFGGSVIDLVMSIYNCSYFQALDVLNDLDYSHYKTDVNLTQAKKYKGKFNYINYINTNEKEIAEIISYAKSRKIHRAYYCGVFFTKNDAGDWIRNPSMMYVHVNQNLEPCGVKFRKIRPSDVRFSARGSQGMYILENFIKEFDDPILYLVESESSANSLWEYSRENYRNVVVISFGSVGSKVYIPEKYKDILDKRLIVDYDGNEELYQQRVNHFNLDNVTPIKLKLNKGEDINSLYINNQLQLYDNLIF